MKAVHSHVRLSSPASHLSLKRHGIRLLGKGLWEGTGRDQIFAHLVEREERICSTLLFVIRSAKHEFVTPCKIPWISWRQPGREKFQGMQQWSTKPEKACNCYPSRSPHLVDGIRTLIVLCAQWQQQLPLVECPLSPLLRAFCSSDTRHYSWRTMLFASCQV